MRMSGITTMKIKGSQLFFRETSIPGKYIVVGLVRVDGKVNDGSLHTFGPRCDGSLLEEDFSDTTRGYALDQIIKEPIWRLK